jgi:hypothetical protein
LAIPVKKAILAHKATPVKRAIPAHKAILAHKVIPVKKATPAQQAKLEIMVSKGPQVQLETPV